MQIKVTDKQLKSILHSADKMKSHRDSDILYGTRMFLKKLAKYKLDIGSLIQEALKPKQVLEPEIAQPTSPYIELVKGNEPETLEDFMSIFKNMDYNNQIEFVYECRSLVHFKSKTFSLMTDFMDYLKGSPTGFSDKQLAVLFKIKNQTGCKLSHVIGA